MVQNENTELEQKLQELEKQNKKLQAELTKTSSNMLNVATNAEFNKDANQGLRALQLTSQIKKMADTKPKVPPPPMRKGGPPPPPPSRGNKPLPPLSSQKKDPSAGMSLAEQLQAAKLKPSASPADSKPAPASALAGGMPGGMPAMGGALSLAE